MVLPILAVTNMTASLDFYVNQLNWTKTFSMPSEDGSEGFAMLQFNSGVSFGLSAMPSPDPKGQGVVLMAYVADDVDIDEYCAQCKSRGANVTKDIRNEYWGDRCFDCSDPDGYFLTICKTIQQKSPEEILASQSSA